MTKSKRKSKKRKTTAAKRKCLRQCGKEAKRYNVSFGQCMRACSKSSRKR